MLNVQQFNRYFSCDKCTEEGECRDRMVCLSESAPLRTDDSFRSRMNEEYHIGVLSFESLPIDKAISIGFSVSRGIVGCYEIPIKLVR